MVALSCGDDQREMTTGEEISMIQKGQGSETWSGEQFGPLEQGARSAGLMLSAPRHTEAQAEASKYKEGLRRENSSKLAFKHCSSLPNHWPL